MHFILALVLLLHNAGISNGIHGAPVVHAVGPEPVAGGPFGYHI